MISDPADPSPSGSTLEALCLTGNQDLDNQHGRIFQALQRLDESLRGAHPLETLGARLRLLETYTLEHFENEEALMEMAGYSLLLPHRAEHELIIERCHALLEQFSAPDSPPLANLSEVLNAHFNRHIREVDMDFVAFLARL